MQTESCQYYTKKRLAQELGVCIRTVDKWMSTGQIGFSKVNRRVFFTKTDLEEFLKGGHRPSIKELDEGNYDFARARYKVYSP
jgi:excisionase family DNA binding protein